MTYATKRRLSLFKRKGIIITLIIFYGFYIGTLIWDCVEGDIISGLTTFVDLVEYPAAILFFLAFILVKNKQYAGIDFMITAVVAAGFLIFVNYAVFPVYWLYNFLICHQVSIIALTLYQFFLGLYLFKTEV